jgi:nucleoside 2-deoxyribosyltransferase
MKVYTAGSINGCTDEQVTGWRAEARLNLEAEGHEVIDPADRDFRGVENETYESIVEGDKADIDECDILLAYCWQPSYGTAMEILYAWETGKLVIAVVPNGLPVSPWVRYHAYAVCPSLYGAVNVVFGLAGKT